MALTPCRECKREVSTEAAACPHCGAPRAAISRIPPKPTQAKKSTALGAMLGIVAIMVGLRVCSEVIHGGRDALRERQSASGAPVLQLGQWSWREESGFAIVEGEVTNISGQSLRDVMAVARFETADGIFITSDDALIDFNPVLPNQASPFKVMATWNPAMRSVRIDFKELGGPALRWSGWPAVK